MLPSPQPPARRSGSPICSPPIWTIDSDEGTAGCGLRWAHGSRTRAPKQHSGCIERSSATEDGQATGFVTQAGKGTPFRRGVKRADGKVERPRPRSLRLLASAGDRTLCSRPAKWKRRPPVLGCRPLFSNYFGS